MKKTQAILVILIIPFFSFLLMTSPEKTYAGTSTPTPTPIPLFKRVIPPTPPPPPKTPLRFKELSLEEGLSQSVVTAILQDRFGFLWVGTQDGLNRYDGHSFTIFRPDPDSPNTINDRWISYLYEDSQGYLWVGTVQGGLNRYNPESGTFTHYISDTKTPNSLSSNRIKTILEDSRGDFWVGTDDGLNRLNLETGEFEHFKDENNLASSLSGNDITVLYEDSRNMLWVGTSKGGINRFNTADSTFTNYNFHPWNTLGHNHIHDIIEDASGNLWVATDQGLNLFNPKTGGFTRYEYQDNNPASLASNIITNLNLDSSGILWVGTDKGLERFQPETNDFFHSQHNSSNRASLSENHITEIYEDREGILWIGTLGGGINKYNHEENKFNYYHANSGEFYSLSSNVIFPIHADIYGRIWIGTSGGGLNRFDPALEKFTHYRHDPEDSNSLASDNISALFFDRDGTLWVGSNRGLSSLKAGTDKFTHYKHDEETSQSLAGDQVYSILEDSQRRLWIGTNHGVDIFNPSEKSFTHYKFNSEQEDSLSDTNVSSIYEDKYGTLWFGTYFSGLNRYNSEEGSFTSYKANPDDANSLTHNLIMAIYEDSSGRLWIATGGGGLNLYNREEDNFSHYTEKDGLPNGFIYGILEDEKGNIWLSTNFGISRFNPEEKSFRNYTASDGLQSNEFNMNAYAKDKKGNLYFGGINGLNVFNPAEIKDGTYKAPVIFTNFMQIGEIVSDQPQVELIREIELPWEDNDFSFEFVTLSYAQPSRNEHAYMLENYDADWNYIGTRRDGRYTNLPGGTYTLRIKGSNGDGIWSESDQSIQITIIPPYWQTWTFRILALIALLGIATIAYQMRVRNIHKQNQKLEKTVQERTGDLQKRTEEIEALYSGNEKIIRSVTRENIFEAIVDVAVNILHADRSVVFIWSEERQQIEPRVSYGFAQETLDVLAFVRGEGLIGHVLETGDAVVISEVDLTTLKPKIRSAIAKEGIRSFVHIPIQVDEEIIGIFNIGFTRHQIITEDTVRLFTALVQRAALSIENRQLFEQTKEVAIIEERNRVARELHDSAKQKAFAALAQLGAAKGMLKKAPEKSEVHVNEAENLVYDVLQELTFLIQEMYPMALKEKGLEIMLREYVFEWKNRNKITVKLKVENLQRVSLEVEQAIYRMIQEALANIARHSQAEKVLLYLLYNHENITVKVQDDGQGFTAEKSSNGMGLRTITERAEEIGGQAFIESEEGNGTTVLIKLPLNKNN
ncbi:MAG: GAF domain-containing protein [Anaerolineae bacterium]|nr:GAF domain-containing protein [Anaerolineae bacterium]MBT7782517.1 GAF domain-containing protein [Anaerolineae bacterium]